MPPSTSRYRCGSSAWRMKRGDSATCRAAWRTAGMASNWSRYTEANPPRPAAASGSDMTASTIPPPAARPTRLSATAREPAETISATSTAIAIPYVRRVGQRQGQEAQRSPAVAPQQRDQTESSQRLARASSDRLGRRPPRRVAGQRLPSIGRPLDLSRPPSDPGCPEESEVRHGQAVADAMTAVPCEKEGVRRHRQVARRQPHAIRQKLDGNRVRRRSAGHAGRILARRCPSTRRFAALRHVHVRHTENGGGEIRTRVSGLYAKASTGLAGALISSPGPAPAGESGRPVPLRVPWRRGRTASGKPVSEAGAPPHGPREGRLLTLLSLR